MEKALSAIAVVAVGIAGWFALESQEARGAVDGNNSALVDASGTAEVIGQVNDGLSRIFSYKFDDPAATDQAAGQVLVGRAREQYDQLLAEARTQATAQKLAVTTRAAVSGVKVLDGDRALLLVFLDQRAVRGDTGAPAVAASQLSVTAERGDGRWRITDLRAL
ncbi:hypothetical protein [Amycolatopsis anabasis]|uniref:hypothetical protein n=1 Tax=Amycolatopsis anabasis TaxID=1840409 RepID=UPI00131E9255|nr:hypothetical protein [Amycolatopsis anabasis]